MLICAAFGDSLVTLGTSLKLCHRAVVAKPEDGALCLQVHVCELCGSEHVQWVGRCPTCKEWNCVKPFKVRREQG